MSDSNNNHDDHHGFAHVMPLWILLAVFFALVGLTCLTVWTASMDFFGMDLLLAMVIATVKATLVMMFFMHLIQDKKFNVLVFISSFLFGALFVGFTLMDKDSYEHRITEQDADLVPTTQTAPPSE
ncbi:MAG: cytochrome C oxidase subunit IV family protein [Planctomycetaceae bacterium]